jgi:hypothetical protein
MICSSLCRVPFIVVLLLGLGELTFYVVQFSGAGSFPAYLASCPRGAVSAPSNQVLISFFPQDSVRIDS